ncbi:MAG: RnfABCDGE type electron transport complex subunit A [Candidatus Altiarchaeota archaeon]
MENLLLIFLGAAVVNNFVLYRFLGLCSFLGISKKTKSAFGMGLAVIFVTTITSVVTWAVYNYLLNPFGLRFLEYAVFILVIATLVQMIEAFLRKKFYTIYESFGIYLPLITTNCVILAVAILNITNDYDFVESTIFSVGAGVGYTMALLIMSGIRERLELADVPESLDGIPLAFIIAGILALAFSGFGGIT